MPRRLGLVGAALASLGGCMVGPDYERPAATVPVEFKELAGWKRATPEAAVPAGAWWQVFDDPLLNALVAEVEVSNQTLAADEAAFRQSRAILAQARAGFYPTLTLDGSVRRHGSGSNSSGGGVVVGNSADQTTTSGSTFAFRSNSSDSAQTTYQPSIGASWDLDLWGRIRRAIEGDFASAQASAADLAAATLSLRSELATDYLQLRARDSQKTILDNAAAAYERSLQITRNQYNWGVATRGDVAQAEAQLESARSQAIATGVERAQFEHAIAMLIGVPPAELTIPPAELGEAPPVVPVALPSTLLERRPDIAAAERRMASANAQIGVAEAAYYPDITLSASFGYSATALSSLFDAANQFWSVGAALAQTMFDAGVRSAQVEQAQAAYDQAVANYRQTTLTAFQDVEDQLAALRIFEQQQAVQDRAVVAAREAERLELNQYKAGTVAYTSVVTAQQNALTNEQTALSIREQRYTATVALIRALGGDWSAVQLPERIETGVPRLY